MLPMLQTLTPTRRRVLGSAAMTMLAARLGMTGSARAMTTKESTMTTASTATLHRAGHRHRRHPPLPASTCRRPTSTTSCQRLAATRLPSKELVDDRSQGVQLATIQELTRYWATDYDWRTIEATLNALPQFTTEIDGVDIHFIHVKSHARERVAADHDPRLARLGHRAARDHRSAHGPDRARRNRRGRLRPGAAVHSRLRLLGPAGRARLGSGPHRAGLGGADAAASATTATSPRAATWAPSSPTRWAARRPKGCSASTPTCW